MKDFDNWNKSKKKIDSRRYDSEESEYFSRPVYIYKKISKINFLVIPLTTSENYKDNWHMEINLESGRKSSLCFNQIKVLDFKRLKIKIDNVGEEMLEITSCLRGLYIESTNPPFGGLGYTEYTRSGASAGALDVSISGQNNKSSKK